MGAERAVRTASNEAVRAFAVAAALLFAGGASALDETAAWRRW